MVSLKSLMLGPTVKYDSHLELTCVIAHARHVSQITEALGTYIQTKHKRGRSHEEIILKLEKLEEKYVHIASMHEVFQTARLEAGLPGSKVLQRALGGREHLVVEFPDSHNRSSPPSYYRPSDRVEDSRSTSPARSVSSTVRHDPSSFANGGVNPSYDSVSEPLLAMESQSDNRLAERRQAERRQSERSSPEDMRKAAPWRRLLGTRRQSSGNSPSTPFTSPRQTQSASPSQNTYSPYMSPQFSSSSTLHIGSASENRDFTRGRDEAVGSIY